MATIEFKRTQKELTQLGRELLPKKFDALGNYPNKVRTQTRAYIILSHAVVESYFESVAKKIARKSQVVFDNKKKITWPLAHLIAFSQNTIECKPDEDISLKMPTFVSNIFYDYYNTIKSNNGIKEANLDSLFIPLGLDKSLLGTTLVPQLDSFGVDRGQHAHNAAYFIQNTLDPLTENARITDLLIELEIFDSHLTSLHNSVK